MKKQIALGLVLVSILSGCASNDAFSREAMTATTVATEPAKEYPKYTYTLRDIPYLITKQELQSFIDSDKGLSGVKMKSVYHADNELLVFDPIKGEYLTLRGYEVEYQHDNSKRYGYLCQVAGYNVVSISARFLPSITTSKGYTSYGYESDSLLYSLEYDLTYGNDSLPLAEKDLIKKLTSVYGEPTNDYSWGSNALSTVMSDHYTYWIADDNSRITVHLDYNSISGYRLTIEYGLYDKDVEKNAWLLNAIKEQAASKKASNTDGL